MTTINHDQATRNLIDAHTDDELLTGILQALGLSWDTLTENQRAHFILEMNATHAGIVAEAMRQLARSDKIISNALKPGGLRAVLTIAAESVRMSNGAQRLKAEADRYL